MHFSPVLKFFSSIVLGWSLLALATPASAADGSWEVPICGAPNDVYPGFVPHGDPMANGIAYVSSTNNLLTIDVELEGQRYFTHHAHLYSPTNDYVNSDVGHSTICWAYDNDTPNNLQTAPFNEKAMSISEWPQPRHYAADWYKNEINKIPENGGDWYLMVHMLGGHFAVDDEGHLIEWNPSVHEVAGDDQVAGNWGGQNNRKTDCNARLGRRLSDTSVLTGTCVDNSLEALGNTNGKFNQVDAPFLDMNGNAWLDENGNLTQDAINHGLNLETEYLFFGFADEGLDAQWGGPEGGAGGWLNPALRDPDRCLAWPPAGWSQGHSHGPDVNPPQITLIGPAQQVIEQYATFVDQGVSVTDDVDSSGSIQVDMVTLDAAGATVDAVDTSNVGVFTISYTATDTTGNSAIAIRQVTVAEYIDQPPTINLSGNSTMTLDYGQAYVEPGVSASDREDGDLTASILISGGVDSNVEGEYTLQYEVTDAAGNKTTVYRTVVVQPERPRTLVPASNNFAIGQAIVIGYTEGSGSNRDWIGLYNANNLPSNGSSHSSYLAWSYTNGSSGSVTFGSMPAGDYTAILFSNDGWNFYGESANFSIGRQDPDITPPQITLIGSAQQVIEQYATFVDQGVSVTDDVDSSGSIQIDVVTSDAVGTTVGAVDALTAGDFTISYTATDSAGNSASTIRQVTVTEYIDQSPEITLIGSAQQVIEQFATFVDQGVSVADDVDSIGSIQVDVVVTSDANGTTVGAVDGLTAGVFTITYTATDTAGNSASTTRQVTVTEFNDQPPTINLIGSAQQVIEQYAAFVDQGVSVDDDVDSIGSIQVDVVVTSDANGTTVGAVDGLTAGVFTITYTATDSAGNSASATRQVTVTEFNDQPPTINLIGSAQQVIEQYAAFVDQGVSVDDDVDSIGSIQVDVVTRDALGTTVGAVDALTAGDFTISYTATDSAGNSASTTRQVTVTEYIDQPPTINLIGTSSVTLDYGQAYQELGASATDKEDEDLTASIVISGDVVNSNAEGSYTVKYEVTDSANQKATVYRTVVVQPERPRTLVPASDNFAIGQAIVIGYTEGSGSNRDWIGLYNANNLPSNGRSHNSYLAWSYTNGSSGSVTLGSLPAGDYTAILFSNNGWNFIGESANFSIGRQGPDVTPPQITLIGSAQQVIEQRATFVDQGVSVTDDIDSSGSIQVDVIIRDGMNTIVGAVDTSNVGAFTISYTATDSVGNSASAIRQVTVTEYIDQPPTINLIGNSTVTLDYGQTYQELGASAIDREDGSLTASIVISGDVVNSSAEGTYTVQYEVTDSAGQKATLYRTVVVQPERPRTLVPASDNFATGQAIVIGYTEGTGSNRDWIGLYNANNLPSNGRSHSSYQAWSYTNGSSGSVTLGTLPAGDYTAILFSDDSWNFYGESVNFSIGR